MNKKWTDQKYIVHFILSILVMTASSGAALGLRVCRSESGQSGEVGVAAEELLTCGGDIADRSSPLAEVGKAAFAGQIPYMASGQREAEVKIMLFSETKEEAECGASFMQESAEVSLYASAAQNISEKDYEALLRIVQAEAGNEDIKGRILVANVVLNRVADERFPMSVYEVVFQRAGGRAQFSPVSNGTYYQVVVTQETKEAVDRALAGEDYSEGALYFVARQYAGKGQMRWFDECLQKLFVYGGHEFFKG